MLCFNILFLDTALFTADVFTDIANGINLYYGPDTDATADNTEENNNDGQIKKAHPIWGALTLATPFLPMLVGAPIIAVTYTPKSSCLKVCAVLLSILLCVPFTAVATPMYIVFVISVGVYRIFAPKSVEAAGTTQGMLKTAEISLESAIQTCLSEYLHLFSLLNFHPPRSLHYLCPWN